jgi:DNA-binding NarL/FixJ family response regulator
MLFRAPSTVVIETIAVSSELAAVQLSPAQRRVLVALCRPIAGGHEFATPASNREIAEELVVSVEAVKTHLRALFEKFGIEDLPRQAKRAQLVRRAFQTGAITPGDLEG